jgi:eukaryotic-like serine/threonine-protein kinase
MTDPTIPDQPQGGLVRRDRLSALASRVGPSIEALRHRPGLAVFLFLVFCVLVALASFQWVMGALVHTRIEVTVPDLKGKTIEQALDVVSPMHLSLAKEGVEFDESLPAGAVLRQAPPAGLKVREGKTIQLTLSSGGKVVFVPPLLGKPLPEAQNLLRAAGMSPGAVSQTYSQSQELGVVMAQVPDPGTIGQKGQMVDLKVSKGPPPEGTLMMPDFLKRPVDGAREWADQNKLSFDVVEEAHADVAPGIVLRQSPAVDAVLSPSEKVVFTVSAGGGKAEWIRYQVPVGNERVQVRVSLRDEKGEKEVFSGTQEPGSWVEVPVVPQGVGRIRVFVAGVLVEERVIE